MVLLLAVAAFTLPVNGQGGDPNYKPKRLNKMIELLEAGQPIYDISVEGVGYEEGKKLSQDRYDLIQYQMEHGVVRPAPAAPVHAGARGWRAHQERTPDADSHRHVAGARAR